jgi:hypothetical protein
MLQTTAELIPQILLQLQQGPMTRTLLMTAVGCSRQPRNFTHAMTCLVDDHAAAAARARYREGMGLRASSLSPRAARKPLATPSFVEIAKKAVDGPPISLQPGGEPFSTATKPGRRRSALGPGNQIPIPLPKGLAGNLQIHART